jgi:putative hemolysin
MMILLIIVLTLLSAFYSGSEAAIFSQDIGRLQRIGGDRFQHKLRKTIIGWLKRPERIITGLLLGNLIVNIAMTNLTEAVISAEFGDFAHREIVLPLVITLYVLTFGEVIPKIIALIFKDTWVRMLQLPLRVWFRFTGRVTIPFDRLAAAIVKPLKPVKSTLSESELVEAVRFAEDHGLLRAEEMLMLSRSIAFYHNDIYSAMIPRSQALMLPEGTSVAQARKAFSGSPHNFAVIYRKNSVEIEGVVYLRGVVQLLLARKKELSDKMHPVEFLPASLSLSEALSALMHNRRDLAVVVDEAGAFIGAVTLRGIINHILGASFTAAPKDQYLTQLDSRRYRVSAQMPLDRFNEIFRSNLNAEISETIGGFILERLDGFPHGEKEIEIGSLVFKSFRVDEHRIRDFVLVVKKNA